MGPAWLLSRLSKGPLSSSAVCSEGATADDNSTDDDEDDTKEEEEEEDAPESVNDVHSTLSNEEDRLDKLDASKKEEEEVHSWEEREVEVEEAAADVVAHDEEWKEDEAALDREREDRSCSACRMGGGGGFCFFSFFASRFRWPPRCFREGLETSASSVCDAVHSGSASLSSASPSPTEDGGVADFRCMGGPSAVAMALERS